MKKYELTDEIKEINGCTLHRIVAVRDFADVKAGDKGGWIEHEGNLNHNGDCWVYGYAKVFGNAMVADRARAFGNAEIYDSARVYDDAIISDSTRVYGDARLHGRAKVYGTANVFGNAEVYDNAMVSGCAEVYEYADVYGNAVVRGNARVCNAGRVRGDAVILGNAIIRSIKDYIVFKNWWSSGRYFTWTRSNNKWKVGCFYGTGDELVQKAYADSKQSGREYERIVKYVEGILKAEKK